MTFAVQNVCSESVLCLIEVSISFLKHSKGLMSKIDLLHIFLFFGPFPAVGVIMFSFSDKLHYWEEISDKN